MPENYDVPLPLDGVHTDAAHRHPDHVSSVAGAHDVATRASSQRMLLLAAYAAIGDLGLTDEDAALIAEVPVHSCWWKRCGELRRDGLIAETGRHRDGRAGVPRVVCVITPAGREALR